MTVSLSKLLYIFKTILKYFITKFTSFAVQYSSVTNTSQLVSKITRKGLARYYADNQHASLKFTLRSKHIISQTQ